MPAKIAIQPDEVVHANGQRQSFSQRWAELAQQYDIEPVFVDVFSRGIIARIAQCDAFMWRYPSAAHPRIYARRLLFALEEGQGIPVFPSLNSAWYYEDKLVQGYFFSAAGIPTPETRIAWSRRQAEQFRKTCDYPFVLKLAGGHQSTNVRLVRTEAEAQFYIEQLFNPGVRGLGYQPAMLPRRLLRRARIAANIVRGENPSGPHSPTFDAELQYGYFYAQEFLPGNDHEISAIVIGHRVFACRRFVRAGDFRTGGSTGKMDWDPKAIGEDAIRLAYKTASKLGAQTVAMDILYRDNEPVVTELTVNYASWVVHACPGHWFLEGAPESARLTWVDGHMRAEDAIFEDFLAEIGCMLKTKMPVGTSL